MVWKHGRIEYIQQNHSNLISFSNSSRSPFCYFVNNKIIRGKSFSAADVLKILGYHSTQRENNSLADLNETQENSFFFNYSKSAIPFWHFLLTGWKKEPVLMKVAVKKFILLRQK